MAALHDNTDEALSHARAPADDVAALDSNYPSLPRFAKAAAGLVTYIERNAVAISNHGERRHYAELISKTAAQSFWSSGTLTEQSPSPRTST